MSARAEEFQSLSATLIYWSFYNPALKCEMGSTALRTPDGLVVIDPSPLSPDAWKELLADDPLRAIFLTNSNHEREAVILQKRYGAQIAAAADAVPEITALKPNLILADREKFYGLTAIAIPGATLGETAFHAPENGVMVVGDAVINLSPTEGLELLPNKYCADAKQNRISLKKLLDFDFHTLTFAHGLPVTVRAKARLAELLSR